MNAVRVPERPACEVKTFRFPGVDGVAILVICAVGFLFALAITFLSRLPVLSAPLMVVRVIIVVLGCMLMWKIWRRRDQEVRTDDSGVTWHPRRDRRVTMSWSEVQGFRERVLRRRLDLLDGSHRNLPLSYDLEDFGDLLKIVHRKTPQLRERRMLMRTFRRHPSTQWVYLVSTLFFIALATAAVVQRELLAVVVGLGASIASYVAYGRTVLTIEVVSAGLVLAARFRNRHVAWSDIAGVELLSAWGGGGALKGAVPIVRIRLRAGKPIDLGAIVEGAIPLFDAVEAAWRRVGTTRADQIIA